MTLRIGIIGVSLITAAVLATAWGLEHNAGRTAQRDFPAAGLIRREYVDSTRRAWNDSGPRPIVTLVFYPTLVTAPVESLDIGPHNAPLFQAGTVSAGAPVAPTALRYPLVVLSHGTGGAGVQLAWLGIALARKGYIVAALNHHGNTGAEPHPDARGFLLWWERARDISVALDRLLADSLFGPHIDSRRIGVAGFSLGGYTALEIAGARTDLAAYAAFCSSPERDFTCRPQPEMPTAPKIFEQLAATDPSVRASVAGASASYRDLRVSAAAALAPALGRALTTSSLHQISIPLIVIVGDSDHVAPPPTNARYVGTQVPGAEFVVLPFVGHYAFLSSCSDRGRQLLAALCVDARQVDREVMHDSVSGMVERFFATAWSGRER